MNAPKAMIIITDRKKTDKILKALHFHGLRIVDIMLGKGTAQSELVSLLGLGETDKSIMLFYVNENKIRAIFELLETEFDFSSPGKGIAFTMPITAVGGPATLRLLDENKE